MSNIVVTHADSGLLHASVVRSERVTPNMQRVTLGGEGLAAYRHRGFDQWCRLAIPVHDDDRFDNLPQRFGIGGYLRFLTLPKGTRPVIRNYTVRAYRADPPELDIDFVVHGTEGIAGPWATSVEAGTEVALIDQGCGWREPSAAEHVLVADESGMPAVLGILRDMPRDSRGHAILEVLDLDDRQPVEAPAGMRVQWLERGHGDAPGTEALEALRSLELGDDVAAFAVGEQALAAGARRHLVGDRGLAKTAVTFSGYWRIGRGSPS